MEIHSNNYSSSLYLELILSDLTNNLQDSQIHFLIRDNTRKCRERELEVTPTERERVWFVNVLTDLTN